MQIGRARLLLAFVLLAPLAPLTACGGGDGDERVPSTQLEQPPAGQDALR